MSYWIEHKDGAVLLAMSGGAAPEPQMGGEVSEVDVFCDPGRCLFLDGEVVDLGPAPSFQHVMDLDTRAWVVPGVSALALTQAAKWEQIKTERDRRESTNFPYLGRWLQCDVVSVLRMTGAKEAATKAVALGVSFAEVWTCADNSLLPVDAEDVLGMLPALAVWSSGLHATARALRAEIFAVDATEASVAAVAWPASTV